MAPYFPIDAYKSVHCAHTYIPKHIVPTVMYCVCTHYNAIAQPKHLSPNWYACYGWHQCAVM